MADYEIIRVDSVQVPNVGYDHMHYVVPVTAELGMMQREMDRNIRNAVFAAISHERCADWIVNQMFGERRQAALIAQATPQWEQRAIDVAGTDRG